MECRITGKITFSPGSRLKLERQVSFESPLGPRVNLRSDDDGSLAVEMMLEAEEEESAREKATMELSRTSRLLSFFYDVRIARSQTTGISYAEVDAGGKEKTRQRLFVEVTLVVRKDVDLGQESAEELVSRLGSEFDERFNDITLMWSEACSQASAAMQYLLLYRLMEFLFKGDGKALTEWIRAKEPTVSLHKDRQRGVTTVYTHLRDNIHPKNRDYPMEDIKKHLPSLRSLTRQLIEEAFGWR